MIKPEVPSSLCKGKSLVVDGSNTSVFTGLLGTDGSWIAKNSEATSPLEGLFPSVEKVLQFAQFKISDIRNFIYCEGPGSILGLRLCAMAIQTWGHLSKSTINYIAYNSLELTATLVIQDYPEVHQGLLISDWKKNAWNSIQLTEGKFSTITTIDDQSLNDQKDKPLFYLPQRKGWQKVPQRASEIEYNPQRLPEALQLLKETKKVRLYASNMNLFKKWIPQRHRAQV